MNILAYMIERMSIVLKDFGGAHASVHDFEFWLCSKFFNYMHVATMPLWDVKNR